MQFFQVGIGKLTGCGVFVREVLEQSLPGQIGNWTEQNYWPDEARMTQDDALVGRKFADAVGENDVVPVILQENDQS